MPYMKGIEKMIKELLDERKLPELLSYSRDEWIQILAENVYGEMPKKTGETKWEQIDEVSNAAGKAVTRTLRIMASTLEDTLSFPIEVTIPRTATKTSPKGAFVFISFGKPKYYPIEELVDQDVIIAEFIMNDVAFDGEEGKTWFEGVGRIGTWAFAASCVLDYLLTLECVDKKRVGVIGHSRLGKTALWAGANDTRFTHIFSNNSGCAGASLTRNKEGEDFPFIYKTFPYWFCENMKHISKTVEQSVQTDFDQHFLLAACAPRKVYVASAKEDVWADSVSEYLCCVAASPAWDEHGKIGFVHPDRLPVPGDVFAEGNVGYHLRAGEHFLSRYDWKKFCEFLRKDLEIVK